MKIVSFFLAIVVMASVLISCKKDKPEAVITGKWEGKFGELTETPAYHYGFVVKPDGTLVRINPNGLVEGLGEWGAIGTAFTGWSELHLPVGTPWVLKIINFLWQEHTMNRLAKLSAPGVWAIIRRMGGCFFLKRNRGRVYI